MRDEQKLDGTAMSSSAMMAMLEILNDGTEPGKLPQEHPAMVDARERFANNKKIGRVFVTSTVEDMEKGNGANLLWR